MFKFTNINSDEISPTKDFLLNCLLNARIETHHETDRDEDVNMYLVGLLFHVMEPHFWTETGKYVSKYDTEIADRVREHNDPVYSYYAYKSNADYYLLCSGLFGGIHAAHLPEFLQISPENFQDRARAYYSFAANLNHQIFHKTTAVSEILGKLSISLKTYLDILHYVKEKYFHLEKDFAFSNGEWFHLEKEVNRSADQSLYRNKIDQLLEAISLFKKDPAPENREKMESLSKELHAYNPAFCAPAKA